ncbi:hypothetical protein Ancab_002829 [Ancistrocladus abbreviatus]
MAFRKAWLMARDGERGLFGPNCTSLSTRSQDRSLGIVLKNFIGMGRELLLSKDGLEKSSDSPTIIHRSQTETESARKRAMEVAGSSKKMIATQEEMVEARVPLAYRDQCAHLLIPLNKCRQAEFYLPWKCENERHIYEKCQYELVMERMLEMQKIREEEKKQQKHGIPLIPNTANAS